MKFTNIISAAAGVLCCAQLMAADEYTFSKPEDWQQPKLVTVSGNAQIVEGAYVRLVGRKLIPVPAGKDLKITGTFRAVEGSPKEVAYIGFYAYDANRKLLEYQDVHPLDGTDTVLAADAKKGDTSILVADGSKWKKGLTVCYDAKPDRSDLPNRNIAAMVADVEKSGDAWKVTLQKPLKVDLAKGIGVRNQKPGGYMYYSFIDTIPEKVNPPRNMEKKLWPHVAYVRFIIFAHWHGAKDAKLEIIDPKVTVIDAATK